MVGAHIPMAIHAQLATNVNITLMVDGSSFTDLFDGVFITLPRSAAIDTLNLTWLASSPLLKAGPVDVLPAGTSAPENVVWLVRFLKLHDTYRTIAFNWLARAAGISDLSLCSIRGESSCWCVSEDFSELGGEERKLIGKVFPGFQDVDENLPPHQLRNDSRSGRDIRR
jgi:hypothetical protein